MNITEKKKALEDSGNQLQTLLDTKKKKLGPKAKSDPDLQHLESLINAIRNGDTDAILEIAVSQLKTTQNTAPNNGRISLQNKIDAAYAEWIIKSKELIFNPQGPIKLYSTPKGRQKRIDELKPILLKESKAWLAHELGYAATTIEELKQHKEALEAEISFLADKFESFCSARKSTVEKQSKGKEKRFKENNDCLEAAFKKFKANLNRAIKSDDFTLYFVTLEHYFPVPPVPEKSDFGGEEWAQKTVRNYFEKITGLSAKYSKREASKLKKEHFSDNR